VSKLHATRTDLRHAWLQRLADTGGDLRRGWGVVPFQCMRLGWTRWMGADPDYYDWHEELTDEGREVLASWNTTGNDGAGHGRG